MAVVRFRPAIGTPDGSTTIFRTQTPYLLGSLRVLINGILQRAALDDGFAETSPPEFEMKVPPAAGDTVWTFYREA